jgi:hypothetical protein
MRRDLLKNEKSGRAILALASLIVIRDPPPVILVFGSLIVFHVFFHSSTTDLNALQKCHH